MAEIVVTGYPRSGNTWLSWLLGDILNCPVGGMYAAKPLATEGQNRPKQHRVYQLHLRPFWKGDWQKAIPSAWCFFVPLWRPEQYKVCHVVRDPRDVAVSIWHYWRLPSLQIALMNMQNGGGPLRVHLSWVEHVSRWLRVENVPIVRYEDLSERPFEGLNELLDGWNIDHREKRIRDAIERQSFARKRAQIEKDGDARVYNKGIHLWNLRKGIVGDWRNHFRPQQIEEAKIAFGDTAAQFGYEL